MTYVLGLTVVLLLLQLQSPNASPEATAESNDGRNLYAAIPAMIRHALDRSDYREVIRLGDALSRPLFESGEFAVRLQVGRMTEEAAAHIGAREVQYRTLIDAIGWSLIELGDFIEAEAAICHGLGIAEDADDWFYVAKASRHIGAIARRRGDLDGAAERYDEARAAARKITKPSDAKAMEAGIMYALAHLQYTRRDFGRALKSVDETIALFTQLNDVYRQDMALVLKADIQLGLQKPEPAADTYRHVIQSSKLNRESVHYVRAVLGLAELHIERRRFDEAGRLLERLDPKHVEQMPAFRERLRAARLSVSTGARRH